MGATRAAALWSAVAESRSDADTALTVRTENARIELKVIRETRLRTSQSGVSTLSGFRCRATKKPV